MRFGDYIVSIDRAFIARDPGWWFEVEIAGCIVAQGWCRGFGPRAKSQAMKDAREAIAARETLLALTRGKVA